MAEKREIFIAVGQVGDLAITDASENIRTFIIAYNGPDQKKFTVTSQYKGERRNKDLNTVEEVFEFLKKLHQVDFENSFTASVLTAMLQFNTAKDGHVEKGKWVEG